ncbi:hypothetical protein QBC35DRAFT_502772 [Podospora australis]|uniref:Nucleoside 2-deoxyribosyltransferase n=1 Tax=Podospora australis TaxID=1536484 RepID=A0AAN6WT49_9PEZI|nr:hypothetical protein QBC35DRAFT_502772 [Podospora australis]
MRRLPISPRSPSTSLSRILLQSTRRKMENKLQNKAQVVRPESSSTITLTGKISIFLAGTTTPGDGPDWRETLTKAIDHHPVTVFNPFNKKWDASWKEDIEFPPFRQQVDWELDKQELADIIVIYFGPQTETPISLLEFGLFARSNKVIVCCDKLYRKRGNVEIVAKRLGVEFWDTEEELAAAVNAKLESLLVEQGGQNA